MATPSAPSRTVATHKTGVAAGVMVLAVAVFAFAFVLRHIYTDGSTNTASDASLKRSAVAMVPLLTEPATNYTQEVSYNQTYGHWVRDLRVSMKAAARPLPARHQFAQLQLIESRTVPPDYILLTMPGHPSVSVDGQAMLQVASSGKPVYGTAHINTTVAQSGGKTLRAYFTRVPVPDELIGEQVSAVLEVFQQ